MASNKVNTQTLTADGSGSYTITDMHQYPANSISNTIVGTEAHVLVTVSYQDGTPASKIPVNYMLDDLDAYFYGKEPGEPLSLNTNSAGKGTVSFICDVPKKVMVTASVGDAPEQNKSVAVEFLPDTKIPLTLNPIVHDAPPDGKTANIIEASTDEEDNDDNYYDYDGHPIEFILDTELKTAYFKDDDGSTSQRYRTITDSDGKAKALFYADSPCEGLLTAKIYTDNTYTTALNSKKQPFVFAFLQLNFPIDRQQTPADGTSTKRTYAYIEDEAPLDICVKFDLSGSSSAKFVEADNVTIMPGGQSATAIIIKGTTRTPQMAFVDDNLVAETVTIQASSAGVCEPTTGSFAFSTVLHANRTQGDDEAATANGVDKRCFNASLPKTEVEKTVTFSLNEEAMAMFVDTSDIHLIDPCHAVASTNKDGVTSNIYLTCRKGSAEKVTVMVDAEGATPIPFEINFNTPSTHIEVNRSASDNQSSTANGSDIHSVYATADPIAQQRIRFSLPLERSATFILSENVELENPFTAYATLRSDGKTPDVQFVDGYANGETVAVTASAGPLNDQTSLQFGAMTGSSYKNTWILSPEEGKDYGEGQINHSFVFVTVHGVANSNTSVTIYLDNDNSTTVQVGSDNTWQTVIKLRTEFKPGGHHTILVQSSDGHSDVKRFTAHCIAE